MRSLSCLIASSLVVLAACDPGWGVDGRVTTVPTDGAPPTPVEDATVRVLCPGTDPIEVQTEADGRFAHGTLGFLSKDCTVEVSAPGLAPRSFTVDDVCERRYRAGERNCFSMTVNVVLEPEGG